MPAPPALISVNIDEADANKSYASDVTLVGDARAVVEQLLPRVEARDGLAALERRLAQIGSDVAAVGASRTRSRPPGCSRSCTAPCRPKRWSSPTCASRATGSRATGRCRGRASSPIPLGWGTLGFGFPASVGAGLAGAGPTVCVIGDGGFMYACGELATVVEARIPLTIVLVEDGGYGMLRFDQVLSGEEPFGVDLVQPDFAALAASFGVPATTVDGFGAEFEDELRRSVAGGEARDACRPRAGSSLLRRRRRGGTGGA